MKLKLNLFPALPAALAILVLAVALKLAWDLFAKPRDIYSITMVNEI